jgi:drug/metabolite transporter (DMT)-like permease
MSNPSSSSSIFQRPAWVALLAFLAAFSWGWAFPLVKLGFAEFGIVQDMTASKMLFAGLRFGIAGVIILIIAAVTGRSFAYKPTAPEGKVSNALFLLLFALLNTTLHYAAFYIGLSYSQGARAAILNSMSVFTLVILACVFFKSDKMTYRKLLGCVIGFAGILTLNVG